MALGKKNGAWAVGVGVYTFKRGVAWQGAEKVSFTAYHSSKLCTNPQVISTSPKTLFD